jgi:hypothetical protein
LVLLPRVFQSHDLVSVDYGLSAIESRVTSDPETAEALFSTSLSVFPTL